MRAIPIAAALLVLSLIACGRTEDSPGIKPDASEPAFDAAVDTGLIDDAATNAEATEDGARPEPGHPPGCHMPEAPSSAEFCRIIDGRCEPIDPDGQCCEYTGQRYNEEESCLEREHEVIGCNHTCVFLAAIGAHCFERASEAGVPELFWGGGYPTVRVAEDLVCCSEEVRQVLWHADTCPERDAGATPDAGTSDDAGTQVDASSTPDAE